MTARPVLCTPLRIEQAALRRAGRSMRLVRTGMGPRRAAATAAALPPDTPVLIVGVAGGLAPHIRPGDLVVATEVRPDTALRTPNSTAELFARPGTALLSSSGTVEPREVDARAVESPSAPLLAGALRRLGLTVHLGPISTVSRIGHQPAVAGSLAVDMESAQLATSDRPCVVVRAIVDTPEHPLWHAGTLHRGVTALRTLRACRPALQWWAAATGPREIRLAPTIAGEVDLMLAIGPDSPRLMEVAQREGVPAYLVNDVREIDLRWLAGTARLGIAAGASPHLVDQIVHCLSGLGPVRVTAPNPEAT